MLRRTHENFIEKKSLILPQNQSWLKLPANANIKRTRSLKVDLEKKKQKIKELQSIMDNADDLCVAAYEDQIKSLRKKVEDLNLQVA